MLETKAGIQVIDISTLTPESLKILKKRVANLDKYTYIVTIPERHLDIKAYNSMFHKVASWVGCYTFQTINKVYIGFADDTYERMRIALYNNLHDKPKVYLYDD
jgi:hypothetical protein